MSHSPQAAAQDILPLLKGTGWDRILQLMGAPLSKNDSRLKENDRKDYSWLSGHGPIDILKLLQRARRCPSVSVSALSKNPLLFDPIIQGLHEGSLLKRTGVYPMLHRTNYQGELPGPEVLEVLADLETCRNDLKNLLGLDDEKLDHHFPGLRRGRYPKANTYRTELSPFRSTNLVYSSAGRLQDNHQAMVKRAVANISVDIEQRRPGAIIGLRLQFMRIFSDGSLSPNYDDEAPLVSR